MNKDEISILLQPLFEQLRIADRSQKRRRRHAEEMARLNQRSQLVPSERRSMIDGLSLRVTGEEVRDLFLKKAAHHRERAQVHKGRLDTYETALGRLTDEDEVQKMSSSTRDPRRDEESAIERHTNQAIEDEFMAAHVETSESYRLDSNDLHRLGVLKSRF